MIFCDDLSMCILWFFITDIPKLILSAPFFTGFMLNPLRYISSIKRGSAESSTNQGYRLKWVKSEPNFTAGQLRSFATAGRYGQTDRVEFPNVST